MLTNPEAIRDGALWAGSKSVVCAVSRRRVNGKDGREVRDSISSRRGSEKMFRGAPRRHWSSENECHRVLDVAPREDDHPLREGHAPEDTSVVRGTALAVLKKAKAPIGINGQRLGAGWDEPFPEHVLRDYLGK